MVENTSAASTTKEAQNECGLMWFNDSSRFNLTIMVVV